MVYFSKPSIDTTREDIFNNTLPDTTVVVGQKFRTDFKTGLKTSHTIMERNKLQDSNFGEMKIQILNLYGESWHKFEKVSTKHQPLGRWNL